MRFTGAFFILLLGGTPLFGAQLNKVGEIVLAPNESARGVSFEGNTAFVSLYNDGVQWSVDISNPTLPVPITGWNPAWGDQWEESLLFDDVLYTGHRFGGLNSWDVSVVNAPAQIDSVSTNYHFDGLDVDPDPGQPLLFYSEHNAGGNPGGLIVYDVSGGSLVPLGSSLVGNNQRDGRFLITTEDGWVYQLDGGAGSTRPLNLNVYDVSVPAAPVHVQMFNMGNVAGNYGAGTDLELDPTKRILYAACGLDGLRMLDVGVRSSPVVVNTLAGPNVRVRELCYVLGTVWMVVGVQLPSGEWRMRLLDCTVPSNPVPVGTWLGDPGYRFWDLCVAYPASGPALLVAGQNAAGEATMQVWM